MATIIADSAASNDVQDAIDISSDGDLVKVPAGDVTWTASVACAKAITLQGAGIGLTNITDGTDAAHEPLDLTLIAGLNTRLTGFSFDGTASSTWGLITVSASDLLSRFRIDHCSTAHQRSRGIVIWGAYGLVDNCVFACDAGYSAQALSIFGDGNAAWLRALTLGTDKAVYVEDCVFNMLYQNDGVIDAYDGARYVFRHNDVTDAKIGHHGLDTGGYRGTFSWEIYENTFLKTGAKVTIGPFRSGTGVSFNNVLTNYNTSWLIANYRTCTDYTPSWDRCDGDSVYDGNADATGWPCGDQIGRSTGAFGAQSSQPAYCWNDFADGVEMDFWFTPTGCTDPQPSDHLQEGRDFYSKTPRPGYVAYTYPHPLQVGANLVMAFK